MRILFVILVLLAGLHTSFGAAHQMPSAPASAALAMAPIHMTGSDINATGHDEMTCCAHSHGATGSALDCSLACAFLPADIAIAARTPAGLPGIAHMPLAVPTRLFPPFRPPV